ncbi:MAG: hypothetical protein AABY22_11835 [Nanoarchaeota archaeon]
MILKLLFKAKFIAWIFAGIVLLLLFFFSPAFKLAIMLAGFYIIYKFFPEGYRPLNNFQMGVLLTAGFIVILFIGKGTGFLSVGNTPSAIRPAVENAVLTPLNVVLLFIIGSLLIMNHKNKRRRR